MNKTMFTLTYLYEACDGNEPYAGCLFVSADRDAVMAKRAEMVAHDCEEVNEEDYDDVEEYEEDAWNEDINFKVFSEDYNEVVLVHRMREDLYAKYIINEVEVV